MRSGAYNDELPSSLGSHCVCSILAHECQIPICAREAAEGADEGEEDEEEDNVGAEGADEEDEADESYAHNCQFVSFSVPKIGGT